MKQGYLKDVKFIAAKINELSVGDKFKWLVNSPVWTVTKIEDGIIYYTGNNKNCQCNYDNGNCKKVIF